MGAIDYGNQIRTVYYYAPADAEVINRIGQNVRKPGIYEGGYLTIVSDVAVTLSALECEITDGTYQERIKTQTSVSVTVGAATPYVILRWVWTGAVSNYMDVMAVAAGSLQSTDLIVGFCNYSGATLTAITYTTRSNPEVFDKFLKVEPTQTPSMYVRVRAGRIVTTAQKYVVDDQTILLTAPVANSRIDLVYVSTVGVVTVLQGVAAASPVAPAYAGKLVLAEITMTSTTTTITTSMIDDARSRVATSQSVTFLGLLDTPSSYSGQALKLARVNAGETAIEFVAPVTPIALGSWLSRVQDTVYLAATDGFVTGYVNTVVEGSYIKGYTDSSNPPTTLRQWWAGGWYNSQGSVSFPVKSGHYWKVSTNKSNAVVFWIPLS